jgi:mono/diheme cytochrome c family protein
LIKEDGAMAKSGGGFWKGVFLVIVVEAVVCLIAALVVQMGGFPMGADVHAPKIEAQLGEWTHDSWVKHHAPDVADPVAVNDQTLMEGAKLYQGNCAVCHGGENYTKSPLGKGVYPGAPQFMRFVEFERTHPNFKMRKMSPAQEQARADHGFYVIKHGIRFTGMPGWKYNMTDTQIWEVVNFMHNMGHLPPDVAAAWKEMPMSPIPVPVAAPAAPAKAAKKK